jgi:SecD/SecF fusion protein
MKNKGAVKFFAIALALVCLFQLSFTFVSNHVESNARDYAQGDTARYTYFIDSVMQVPVYNVLVKEYTFQEVKERELNLGLDLRGGMNVTLELSVIDIIRDLSNKNTDPRFQQALSVASERAVNSQKEFVTLFGEAWGEVAPGVPLSTIFATKENKDYVTTATSDKDVLDHLRTKTNDAIDIAFEILRTRVDKFGTTNPNIQKLGNSGRILVELPGVKDPERIRKLLQGSARLQFFETYDNADVLKMLDPLNKIIKGKIDLQGGDSTGTGKDTSQTGDFPLLRSENDADTNTKAVPQGDTAAGDLLNPSATDTGIKDTATKAEKTNEELRKDNPLFALLQPNMTSDGRAGGGSMVGFALIKDTAKINEYLNYPEVKAALGPNIRFLWEHAPMARSKNAISMHAIKVGKDNAAAMEGDVITDARPSRDQAGNMEVTMNMNASGSQAWRKLTGKNIGHSIAIVLDDQVYSSPNVMSEISGGSSQISGNFTIEEAKDLSNILKAGKLPAKTRIVQDTVVGPTLGQQAIDQGFLSFLIGFIAVIVFMIVYYNRSGLIADVAVIANVFFILGVLASLGSALTLPGIAGIVLTIGMAVDANVLIYERIKEELALGKSTKNAIADGFRAANSSIIDSNLTTLLTGIILYIFGSGPVQGFAVTLIIGILSSMFTAVLLTRVIMEWWLERGHKLDFSTSLSRGLFQGKKYYDFVGHRKKFYVLSAIIIIAGIISLTVKGFNYGVDFKGGWSYDVAFEEELSTTDVRNALSPALQTPPEVKTFGSKKVMKITTTYLINDTSSTASAKVEEKLKEGFTPLVGDKYEILRATKVGAVVANDIKRDALLAMIFAMVGIFLYILARFKKMQYSLGATFALAHDVFIVVALYSLCDGLFNLSLEVDQAFIAAILTLIGYSINDTVVVFDRLREYLANNKSATDSKRVINDAINKTLSRTIVTALTVFLVSVVLFIFGGEVIRGFSFTLVIGVIAGTYSSVCVAAPLVVDLDKRIRNSE